MRKGLTIGALAKATATKIETIRYYERIALLPRPARSAGNYRLYGAAELGRLGFIRRSRALGFSVEAVRELLRLEDGKRRSCGAVAPIVRKHLGEVESKIAALRALRRELRRLVTQCEAGVVDDCRVIGALGAARAPGAPIAAGT